MARRLARVILRYMDYEPVVSEIGAFKQTLKLFRLITVYIIYKKTFQRKSPIKYWNDSSLWRIRTIVLEISCLTKP